MTGYDSEGDTELFGVLKKLNLTETRNCFHYYKSHHVTHAEKLVYSSGFKDALVFVGDGRNSSYTLENGQNAYETLSVYLSKQPFSFECKYKKLLSPSEGENKIVLHNSIPLSLNSKTIFEVSSYDSLCPLYTRVSGYIGFDNDNEGKTMGLRAYGGGDGIGKAVISPRFILKYDLNNKYQIRAEPKIVAFEVQRIFENTFKEILNKFKDLNKNIILTGGGALNILNNHKVLKYLDTGFMLILCVR